ncbi:MAG: hypothetical protein COU47_03055, partial [Candidatus Niyogibacteria bacterium CG10_big_fil_rev_8_21_14_0_10_46_36]
MQTNVQNGYGVPLAIIAAGLLIAGAVFFTGNNNGTVASDNNANNTGAQPSGEFRMPSEDDHIRGATDAKVTVIEYSDFNCSFCARLHPTLTRIVEEYDGEVNWVYRHFANYAQGRV